MWKVWRVVGALPTLKGNAIRRADVLPLVNDVTPVPVRIGPPVVSRFAIDSLRLRPPEEFYRAIPPRDFGRASGRHV